jgi:putative ABC transport system permease protein
MIKMYINIALRNLMRNRLFSVINIVGLALAMSVGLIFVLNIKKQFDFDQHHPYPERTYRIVTDKIFAQGTDHFATSPALLAQELQSYPFVETVTRLHHSDFIIASGNGKELPLSIRHTDPSFLNVFEFELQQKNNQPLTDPNTIIISERKARDFWGDQEAVGQTLTLPGKGNFKVTGVIKENKKPTHFHFDALVSSRSLKDTTFRNNADEWADLAGYTYVLLNRHADEQDLKKALHTIANTAGKKLRSRSGETSKGYHFVAQNLLEINPSRHSMVIDEMNRGLDWGGITVMSGLILILMAMVAFNYTGLSLARSLSRAKEVGIRKINGAKRYQIFVQFLTESIILTLISLVFSLLILPFLDHIPLFREIIAGLDPDVWSILWVLCFTVIISLVAGGLPAWLLSSFEPIMVLQKLSNYRLMGGLGFRKVLITVQFTIAIIFITFLVISKKQIDFERDFDYGFSGKNLIFLQAENKDIEALKLNFSQIASVREVSATSGIPLRQLSSGSCFISQINGEDSLRVKYYAADQGFLPGMGIQLVSGTNFSADIGQMDETVVILNEKAVKELKFKNASEAVGKYVTLDRNQVQIIGVYKDFINWNLRFGSMPFALRYKPAEFDQLIIKVSSQNEAGTVLALKSAWDKVKPKVPFKYEFYETFINSKYEHKRKEFLLIDYLTALVMSLCCLGLVGMVAYSVELRVKEIGIRRTLGAAGGQLIWLVSRDFMKILVWAGVLGLPVGYYIGYTMLKEYAYRVDLSAGLFLSSFLIMFVLGLLTILSQTYRVSYVNPVDSLRAE